MYVCAYVYIYIYIYILKASASAAGPLTFEDMSLSGFADTQGALGKATSSSPAALRPFSSSSSGALQEFASSSQKLSSSFPGALPQLAFTNICAKCSSRTGFDFCRDIKFVSRMERTCLASQGLRAVLKG